ncbi:MAG TPA: hypothetical protein PLS00_00045 [Niabella sp.]|nr:hypothetical protein [Niabella sp.]
MRRPLLYFLVLFIACSPAKEEKYPYEIIKKITKEHIEFENLKLDSMVLEKINTSFLGKLHVFEKSIYFIDEKFCYVNKFDENGRFQNRYIGFGSERNELPLKKISFSTILPNGKLLIIGPTWDCYVFDKDFNYIDDYAINWHSNVSTEEMLKRPDYANSQLYTLAYGVNLLKANNNFAFLPLISQHPDFNPTNKNYSTHARVLGKMRIKNGYVEKIYGRLPPSYLANFNKQVFPYILFDLGNNEEMFSIFPADSSIYRMSNDFKIISIFGFQGKGMDTSYLNVDSVSSFTVNMKKQYDERGYYTSIKYIKEREILFRSYNRGLTQASGGLQAYHDEALIADIDVPKGFEVVGYIAPYFYSNAFIDEEKGEIKVFKFKID